MRLRLMVNANETYFTGAAAIDVSDFFRRAFEPLKTTDDAMLSLLLNEPMPSDLVVKEKVTLRKDAAEYLAREIAGMLVNEMQKRDTHNGYTKSQGVLNETMQ